MVVLRFFIAIVFIVSTQYSAYAGGVPGMSGAAGGANIAAAAANSAIGRQQSSMCPEPNPMACIMALLSMLQAMANGKGKNNADATGFSATPISGFDDSNPGTPGLGDESEDSKGGSGLTAAQQRDFKIATDILAEKGISVASNGTVTGPNGVIPASAFSNPESLAEHGFSSDEIDGALKSKLAMDKTAQKYKNFKLAYGGGGGGGGGKAGVSQFKLPELDKSLYSFNSPFAKKKKSKGSLYAGFSRNLAGVPIGVSGDDIFKMLQRRYQAKKRANYFLP